MNCSRCGKEFKLTDWNYSIESFTLCNDCYKKAKIELEVDKDEDM